MARPRLDDEERRARTVGVRVTAAEAAELRELNRIGVNLNQMGAGAPPAASFGLSWRACTLCCSQKEIP